MHHDFVLVKKSKINTENKMNKVFDNYFNNNQENLPYAKIEDDIIIYMLDTLKWIRNDYTKIEEKKGLAYYGITLIKDKNAEKLSKIMKAWATLFAQGDKEFELTGMYTLFGEETYDEITDSYYKDGQYEKIRVVRAELLKDLKKLISILEKAINDKEYCVVHMGI